MSALTRMPVRWSFFLTLALATQIGFSARSSFGVYEGPGSDGARKLGSFSTWFGRIPDRALDFFANDSWPSLESDAAWTCYSWHPTNSGAVVPAMTFSVPLTVNGTPLSEVASGLHDSSFRAVASDLVAYGWGKSVVRLGWEFNGSWMPWAAGRDPVSYVAAYRHVVTLMRSVPGANFTFDWCSSWGPAETAPDSVYPGDDVVDIIGMDVYNRFYSASAASAANRWSTYLNAAYGLNWLQSFSKLHGKTLSIPEWGTGESLLGDGAISGGDDPAFVSNMSNYINGNNAAYSTYWDINASGYNGCVSDGEHSASGRALKLAFGVPVALPGQVPWIGYGDQPTASSVSINFAPTYDGGTPDYYTISYRITGQSSWIPYANVTSVGWQPVNGLKSGTSYDVHVFAVNSSGSGVVSPTIQISTLSLVGFSAATPGMIPWIGLGDASTSSSISINFAPPNNGGTATSYVIMYRISGQTTWSTYGSVTWTGWQTLAGLKAATSYETYVYAVNAAGQGLASSVFTDRTL